MLATTTTSSSSIDVPRVRSNGWTTWTGSSMRSMPGKIASSGVG